MRNIVAEKKELRKMALLWWISLPSEYKFRIKRKYYPLQNTYTLSGRQIEYIYVVDPKSPYLEDKLRTEKQQHGKTA